MYNIQSGTNNLSLSLDGVGGGCSRAGVLFVIGQASVALFEIRVEVHDTSFTHQKSIFDILHLCNNMMLHQLIVAVLVLASIDVQCHAFRRIARRSTLPISTINKSGLHSTRHLKQPRYQYINFYSIRGGSDNNDEDQYDYDDEFTLDFIASFESELAEIRREAEREAENEMLKLRGLIERRGVEEDVDVEDDDAELNNNADAVESKENDQASSLVEEEEELKNAIPEEEESDTISNEEINVIDPTETESEEVLPSNESEEVLPSNESGETIDLDNDVEEEETETIMVEDDDYLQYQEITEELPDESVVIGDYSDEESDTEATPNSAELVDEPVPIVVDETIAIVDETEEDDDTVIDAKSKVSKKKKKKASKQGKKKKKKTRINVSEESKLSEHGEQVIDLGDSVMLSKEVAEPRQSGIMFYLRSDLGRALCLFIATIALAILTTRMQRQMEAEGI